MRLADCNRTLAMESPGNVVHISSSDDVSGKDERPKLLVSDSASPLPQPAGSPVFYVWIIRLTQGPARRDDERRLTADIIELARQYGRYGHRKVAALLRQADWTINDKRVERI
jgi:HTH-like domain